MMGEVQAAVVVACILQRGAAIRSAGGYLRGLTEKAESRRVLARPDSDGADQIAIARQAVGVMSTAALLHEQSSENLSVDKACECDAAPWCQSICASIHSKEQPKAMLNEVPHHGTSMPPTRPIGREHLNLGVTKSGLFPRYRLLRYGWPEFAEGLHSGTQRRQPPLRRRSHSVSTGAVRPTIPGRPSVSGEARGNSAFKG